jgi:hypothetical protein
MWWCDTCDPYQMGANQAKLSLIRTYQDANLPHLGFGSPKSALRDLVKIVAVEKGLPNRVGQKEAEEFFAEWWAFW